MASSTISGQPHFPISGCTEFFLSLEKPSHDDQGDQTSLAVDMTTEGTVVCQQCFKAQPEGVALTFVQNGDNARCGRNCCPGCLSHYQPKKAGLHKPDNENEGMHFNFTT